MTHNEIVMQNLIQIINENGGIDVFSDAMTILMDTAMKNERCQVLQAEPYERTENRQGYANGFKPKTMRTGMGKMTVQVPQVRGDIEYYPAALTKGSQVDQALMLAVAQMYIQGVSTRKVKHILEKLSDCTISSSTVSKATALLDETLSNWRNRSLKDVAIAYLILDARYEKARIDGVVRDVAVLVAIGVQACGKRTVLGVSTDLSEAEVHWRAFMQSLLSRGLHGMKMITSDDHAGLQAARKAIISSVPWQRCQFHLQQNASNYVPKKAMEKEVADDIRDIFNAPSLKQATERLVFAVEKYADSAPELSAWMESNIPEGLTVFTLPKKHRKRLRTSNWLENLNGQIKRRTKVVGVFPNVDSVLRLVSAVLMETDERWVTGTRYLNMEEK